MGIKRHVDGKRWQVDYYTPDGKRKRPIFKSKAEAKAFETEMEASKRGGTYVDPSGAKGVTVSLLHERWIKVIGERGATGRGAATLSTVKLYQKIYRNQIQPYWEHRPIGRIDQAEVETWISEMTMSNPRGETLPASELAKSKAVKQFSRMFDYAVAEGMLGKNPVRNRSGRVIPTPTPKTKRSQVRLTMRQLLRVSDACRDYRLLVLFTGLTGLRWGEVTTLQSRHLDYGDVPTVMVEAAHAKTHEGRIVPIPASVAREMEKLTLEAEANALVFPSLRGKRLNSTNFHKRHYDPAAKLAAGGVGAVQRRLGVKGETKREQANGKAVQLARYGERTERAVRDFQQSEGLEDTGTVNGLVWAALGLEDYEAMSLAVGDTDFIPPTFHNLRHTAVSLAISAGANIKVVQRIAGHKSATMTLDVYGDLFDDDLADSAKRLDAELSRSLAA